MIKIAISQINPVVGDLKGNYEKIVRYIVRAKDKGADLVVFSELVLCGYPPEDLLHKPHFIEENLKYLRKIIPHTGDICVMAGFVNKEKNKIYNACAVIENKNIKNVYHKAYLPNHGVFDEKRYFSPGRDFLIFDLKGYKVNVNICQDIWTGEYVSRLRDKGLDLIVNLSASPYHLGKLSLREKVLSRAAGQSRACLVYCNLVGGQDELVFDGTSMVFSPRGKLITVAARFKEDFRLFSLGKDKTYRVKSISSNAVEEVFSALKLGLFDYVNKHGFKKVIVGVSGGIDSAVVAALAGITLGPENTHALIMPSQYTSQETFRDAEKVCVNLGIKYSVISIEDILKSYLRMLRPFFGNRPGDKTEENLQARIRGALLMAFSNKFGFLVLNTGNKSEVSCGYCTLYGDMVGGFGVLKDVTKTMVYKLARYINKIRGSKAIPLSIIRRPPSAELRPGQLDTDTLPEYSLLDPILKLYIEEDRTPGEIIKAVNDEALVLKVIRMVDSSEYKRRQAPIGIKITPKAFGKDRRMPIVNKFMR